MRYLAVLTLIALPMTSPVQAAPDFEALSQEIIDEHIAPRYAAFADQAAQFEATAGKWCDGTLSSKAPVEGAFNDAVSAWQSIEHIRFGVAAELSAHSRVNYWPDRGDRVNKHLRQLMASPDLATIVDESFFGRSIAVQGFPAVERLLYDTPYTGEMAKTCPVVKAIAHNITAVANILSSSWHGATAEGDLVTAAFNDLSTNLEAIADAKLRGPSGADSGKIRPKLAENWRSKRALLNVAINLEALQDLYQHLADGAPAEFLNSQRDQHIRNQFAAVIAMTRSIGPDLTEPLATDPGRTEVLDLAQLIKSLRNEVIAHLSESLSIPLGFNSLDGD